MGSHIDQGPLPLPLLLSPSLSNLHSRRCFQLCSLFLFTLFPPLNISLTIIPIFYLAWHLSSFFDINPEQPLSQASAGAGQLGWGRGNVCAGMDPGYTQEMLNCGIELFWVKQREKVQWLSELKDCSVEMMWTGLGIVWNVSKQMPLQHIKGCKTGVKHNQVNKS